MIERQDPYVISEKREDEIEIANWVFNSHWWVEEQAGVFNCKWCNNCHSSTDGITVEYPICRENPILKKLLVL